MSWTIALGSVGVVLASMLIYTRFHLDQSKLRHPPRGEHVTVDGVRTHVLREGGGNDDTVVLLHGLNGVLEDFTGALIDRLAEDHEVVALDRPGYGYTERPDPTLSRMDRQAAWLEDLLDELDVEDALVVGHSLGGGLATRYALEHPDRVRGLVLLAPYLYPNHAPPDLLHSLPDLPIVREVFAHLFLVPVGRPLAKKLAASSFEPEPMPPSYVHLWADLSLRPSQFLTVMDEARHLDDAASGIQARYRELEVPTLVLTGDEDRLVDPDEHARRFHAEVPEIWLRTIEGAGHMLPWTQPYQVVAAIEEVAHLGKAGRSGNGHGLQEAA